MKTSLATLVTLAVLVSLATAADGPSIERGKELFNSATLGTNGKSCSLCHPEGKGLGNVTSSGTKQLEDVANQCIVKALKGKALASGSVDLISLTMYVKTFGSTAGK